MLISLVELQMINDAAKLFKGYDKLVIDQFGLKAFDTNCTVCKSIYINMPMEFYLRNQIDLTQEILLQSDISNAIIPENNSGDTIIEIPCFYDYKTYNAAKNIILLGTNCSIKKIYPEPILLNDELQRLGYYNMRASDGARLVNINLDSTIIPITIFSGFLPLRKNDEVYIQIYNNNPHQFITEYTIKRKGLPNNIKVYYNYLSLY